MLGIWQLRHSTHSVLSIFPIILKSRSARLLFSSHETENCPSFRWNWQKNVRHRYPTSSEVWIDCVKRRKRSSQIDFRPRLKCVICGPLCWLPNVLIRFIQMFIKQWRIRLEWTLHVFSTRWELHKFHHFHICSTAFNSMNTQWQWVCVCGIRHALPEER